VFEPIGGELEVVVVSEKFPWGVVEKPHTFVGSGAEGRGEDRSRGQGEPDA